MSLARTLLTIVSLAAASSRAAGADWPQFLGPERNGHSVETGLKHTWNQDGPPVLWRKDIGAGFAGPVVAGGKLVLFHRLGDQEQVELLNGATGKEIWRHAYATDYRDDFGFDEGPRSTPTIAADRVVTLGAAGMMHVLRLSDGGVVWKKPLNDEYKVAKGFFGVATSPLVTDGMVIVNVGGRGAGIIALALDDGRELWRATTDEASYSSPVLAAWDGKKRVIFLTRNGIAILEPATGKVLFQKRWRARINASVNASTPVVAEKALFFTSSYGTGAIALDAAADRFEPLWQGDESLSCHYATPLAWKGLLFGFDGRQEQGARLRAVELATGKVKWTRERFGCGSMILADDHLYILTENGALVCAEANPGAYRETARAQVLIGPCRAQPALSDGRLYARDGKRLIAWNLKTEN